MRKSFLLCIALFMISASQAQIDFSKDTISRADVLATALLYKNNLAGAGKKATERINVPVNKIKAIMDACDANGITEVSVIIITLRAADVPRYRRINPTSTAADADIIGSQLLIFRVPRAAFPNDLSIRNVSKNNPLMTSLLAAGLFMIDTPLSDLPFGAGSVFFTVGSICPPPATCNN